MLVGTTTIMFGPTRYGPLAPVTSQLGKNDVRTNTGVPTLSTSKDIESRYTVRFDTLATGVATSGAGDVSFRDTRGQSAGPDVAGMTAHRVGSLNQSIDGFTQSWMSSLTSVHTAGLLASPTTSGASATWYTVHGPDPPMRVNRGSFWANASTVLE